jgi:hypothetical protein
MLPLSTLQRIPALIQSQDSFSYICPILGSGDSNPATAFFANFVGKFNDNLLSFIIQGKEYVAFILLKLCIKYRDITYTLENCYCIWYTKNCATLVNTDIYAISTKTPLKLGFIILGLNSVNIARDFGILGLALLANNLEITVDSDINILNLVYLQLHQPLTSSHHRSPHGTSALTSHTYLLSPERRPTSLLRILRSSTN